MAPSSMEGGPGDAHAGRAKLASQTGGAGLAGRAGFAGHPGFAGRTGRTGDTLRKLNAFWNRDAANWLSVDFSEWGGGDSGLFAALKNAILERFVVTFEYYGTNGMKSFRRVEPLQLCFKSKAWYLKGTCLEKNEERLFKLRRIVGLAVTDDQFAERRASGREALGAGANAGGGSAIGSNAGGGAAIGATAGGGAAAIGSNAGGDAAIGATGGFFNDYANLDYADLVLKIDARMAYRVYDDFDAEKLARHEDGSFIVDQKWPMDEWAYSLLLSYGEHLEVVEPQSVRAEIQGRLARMHENYAGDRDLIGTNV